MRLLKLTGLGLILLAARTGAVPAVVDLSSHPAGPCQPDGTAFGPWRSAFAGHGCTKIRTDGRTRWLDLRPAPSRSAGMTLASLVLGPSFGSPLTLSADLATAEQLRRGGPPNSWEVAWLVWHYEDDAHFYYFIPKPDGWELGKRDPAYPGGQRYLATGDRPAFPVGTWTTVRVYQTGNKIRVYADGALLADYTDEERPYLSGRIGLYTEDAHVLARNVYAAELTPE